MMQMWAFFLNRKKRNMPQESLALNFISKGWCEIKRTGVWAHNFFVCGLIFKKCTTFFCQDYANSKIVKFVSVGCLGCEILAKMFRSDIGKMVGFCKFFCQWLFLEWNHKMGKEKWVFFNHPHKKWASQCSNNQANCFSFR